MNWIQAKDVNWIRKTVGVASIVLLNFHITQIKLNIWLWRHIHDSNHHSIVHFKLTIFTLHVQSKSNQINSKNTDQLCNHTLIRNPKIVDYYVIWIAKVCNCNHCNINWLGRIFLILVARNEFWYALDLFFVSFTFNRHHHRYYTRIWRQKCSHMNVRLLNHVSALYWNWMSLHRLRTRL